MRLITHSGTFHADDVMAYAVLSRVFPGFQLVRTRDHALLSSAGQGDIVFDVGMAYAPAARRYDHHMKNGPKRPDGVPYSSVGLAWRHHGHECVATLEVGLSEDARERVWHAVDKGLIRDIDMLDNGVGTASAADIAAAIDDFNPSWDDLSTDPDSAFREAARFAGRVLERRISAAAAAERAFSVVIEAASNAEDPRIIVLSSSMPWEKALFDGGFEEALYVVYPRTDGSWFCSAVPPELRSFAQRKPLPAEWAGLRDAKLAEVSGVSDAIFCHPGLFVCAAGSAEGIMKMAYAAADAPEPQVAIRP